MSNSETGAVAAAPSAPASGQEKFTPGPWHAERRKYRSVVLQADGKCDGYRNRVAECPQWSPAPHPQPTPDDAFANAQLIAAAPDLFHALQRILRTELMLGGSRDLGEAALRKALGLAA